MMKSTPAMRARIRELMSNEQDDYDRAVECVLDDFEALEAALREIRDQYLTADQSSAIAKAALAGSQDK